MLAPEQIGTLWGIPITNTLLTSWVAITILIIAAIVVRRRLSYVPGRFQALLESLVIYMQDFIKETLEDEKWSRRAFPLLITIFLFIATSNLIEFTPGIGSVGFYAADGTFTPLLRSVNTDLNVTLTLAIISVISIEVFGIIAVGFWTLRGQILHLPRRGTRQPLAQLHRSASSNLSPSFRASSHSLFVSSATFLRAKSLSRLRPISRRTSCRRPSWPLKYSSVSSKPRSSRSSRFSLSSSPSRILTRRIKVVRRALAR